MPGVQLINQELFDQVLEKARNADRKRSNYNFHKDDQANPHRFLNVMCKGTYCAPHRHKNPAKDETFLILRGEIAFILFNNNGEIKKIYRLSAVNKAGDSGIDIPAGCWHTLVVLSDEAICFEVKPGPYNKNTDKDFAPWAPQENEEGWQQYLEKLTNEALKH